MLLIESVLTVTAVLVALLWPQSGGALWHPLEKSFVRLARNRKLSIAVVGLSALALRLALLPVLPVPKPAIHDEFSYLLAGDTFAHWRLTNPQHPMWIHFETFHVIQQPTYASMYYPAQGMFLAAGEILFHHAFWGVWLSNGLMCAAICWMLQAWVGPVWAFFGGMLAVIRIAAFSYWDNSYWGGAVAALGGALVIGALPRIMRAHRRRDAVMMGLGFALLVNSRPYETVFFGLGVVAVLGRWLARNWNGATLRNFVAPFATVALCTVMFMGYYNWRTTNNVLRSPYFVNLASYNSVPYFPWLPVRTPVQYHHAVMKRFYLEWWRLQYNFARFHPGMFAMFKFYTFWSFFLGPLLTIPLAAALLHSPVNISIKRLRPSTEVFLLVCGFVFIGAMLPAYFNPHYVAAVTCVIYGLIMISLMGIRRWRFGRRPVGVRVMRSVIVIAVVMLGLRAASPALRIANPYAPATWCSPEKQNSDRASIVAYLEQKAGDHLVFVRYGPDHVLSNEWVYNEADINASKVLWARDMGTEQNAELLHYFSQRHAWVVEPDVDPVPLQPYSGAH